MAGIFPKRGVPFDSAENGVDAATTCPNSRFFYGTGSRCSPRIDAEAINAYISELLYTTAAAGLPYDCDRLDNLARAVSRILSSAAASEGAVIAPGEAALSVDGDLLYNTTDSSITLGSDVSTVGLMDSGLTPQTSVICNLPAISDAQIGGMTGNERVMVCYQGRTYAAPLNKLYGHWFNTQPNVVAAEGVLVPPGGCVTSTDLQSVTMVNLTGEPILLNAGTTRLGLLDQGLTQKRRGNPPQDFANKTVYAYTGAEQTFNIPPDAQWLRFKAWGAGSDREAGGFVSGIFHVDDLTDSVLKVMVGEQGRDTAAGANPVFGFGGSAREGANTGASSGGGLSGVFLGSGLITETSQDRALVIAGGAGGYGAINGGSTAYRAGGTGGSETSGGEGSMQGRNAPPTMPYAESFGGGGGGYYGGSSEPFPGRAAASGAGGTNFVGPPGVRLQDMSTEENRDIVQATGGLDYPNDDDPPNASDSDRGSAGSKNNDGRVVIEWE